MEIDGSCGGGATDGGGRGLVTDGGCGDTGMDPTDIS